MHVTSSCSLLRLFPKGRNMFYYRLVVERAKLSGCGYNSSLGPLFFFAIVTLLILLGGQHVEAWICAITVDMGQLAQYWTAKYQHQQQGVLMIRSGLCIEWRKHQQPEMCCTLIARARY